jgi:hypothetical protein
MSGRQTGSYPETGFEEIASDFLEPDFWPEITSSYPVTCPNRPSDNRGKPRTRLLVRLCEFILAKMFFNHDQAFTSE